MRRFYRVLVPVTLLLGAPSPAWAWLDSTHKALTEAAGATDCVCASIVPDAIAKLRKSANEPPNHFYNGTNDSVVTPALVYDQVKLYTQADPVGHLYGATLAALREYIQVKRRHEYDVYFRGAVAHYVGDLVQPLHNSPFDDFNKQFHFAVDGMVEHDTDIVARIKTRMTPVVIDNEEGVVAEIVRLAKRARAVDAQMRDGTGLTKSGAYALLGDAASVLKAMFVWADRAAN